MKEGPLTLLTFTVLLFTGVVAIAGGIPMILNQSGEVLGTKINLLNGPSFSNYLILGLLLFGVIGIGSLVAAFILWKKPEISWITTMLAGIALIIWITLQVSITGYVSKLQPFILLICFQLYSPFLDVKIIMICMIMIYIKNYQPSTIGIVTKRLR